ncbi:MAG TPA: glutathione peroxidase [Candidatus Poseidoniaceae archaeon]|nr:glutathione peroxidase [Euryarchaeota archaeon]DAC57813.1 MAG TPA: glutathione peroxidase [Candidatus Poseidoniales archaeon]HII37792.1 glutathione peroxidase [Candidatus Poseidoniaceae archaeon]|tara:strand:- start:219 stop:683 length:465 start_codon:yes stop_codon:yes gene_type:complete
MDMHSVLDIEFLDMNGDSQTLRSLGSDNTKRWLVVNVASRCGLTRHYTNLQDISNNSEVTVVGFPCNQFGSQEPGSHQEICDFTNEKYGVTFPLMAKIEVNGQNRAELFEHLTATRGVDGHEGSIRWNFEKFLIDFDGNVTRYSPQTKPEEIFF